MSDWSVLPLREVAVLIKRGRAPRYSENGAIVVNQKCIQPGNRFSTFLARRTDTSVKSVPDWAWLQEIDSVVNSTGRGTLGRAAFVGRLEEPATADSHVAIVRPDVQRVVPEFLGLVLSSQPEAIERLQSGSTSQTELSPTALGTLPIALPPLAVQRRIVDLLAHLDNHLANLQTEREAAEVLLAVSRRSLVASADLVPLATLATEGGVQIGPFGSQLHASDYTESGIPVVMPKNLIAGRIHEEGIKRISTDTAERLSRHLLKAGDIVFPRRGDLAKRALVTDSQEGWLCGTGCIRFRPNEDVDGTTIFQAISGKEATDWLTEHAVGTTMLNLNTEIVSKLPVADPRTGSGELAEACRAQALLLEALKEESERLEQVRRHLISSLLSGEVEVPLTYDSLLSEVA